MIEGKKSDEQVQLLTPEALACLKLIPEGVINAMTEITRRKMNTPEEETGAYWLKRRMKEMGIPHDP